MKNLRTLSDLRTMPVDLLKTSAVLLIALGLGFGFWSATAQTSAPQGGGHTECVVCHNMAHNPHTLTIDCNALPAHLAHGDKEGPCETTPVTNP